MSEPGCLSAPLSAYPRMNQFVLDWLAGEAKATRFLPRTEWSGGRKRSAPQADLAAALIESNRHWGLFVREDVERWASGEAMAIVAGQQVGFAGGPLYTLAKIASLKKMKRDLEAAGQPVTLFFWLATEDHDFAEAATLSLPVRTIPEAKRPREAQLDLIHLRASRGVESREVIGSQSLPPALVSELLALYGLERPAWLREGISFRDSFAELLATVCGGGIVLVDSLLPELRRAGAPLFQQIASQWQEIQSDLKRRSGELEAAGYVPQVTARDGEEHTLLFRIDQSGIRRAFDRDAALQPESISTSALTRPLLQDFVLQPDVFVGGPAEVAYYAQITPLHARLGVALPRVALRGHTLVAPKRVLRLFSRFDLLPADVFRPLDQLEVEREPEGVLRVQKIADEAKAHLFERIAAIREIALPADHSLTRSVNRSIGHLDYHFAKLAERAIRGLARKNRERHAALRELKATFHPDGQVQDRVVSWFAWWCQFGNHLFDRMIEEVEPDGDSFNMIGL